MPGMRDTDPAERRSRALAAVLRKTLPAAVPYIRNGWKSGRQIINRPFRSVRTAEKPFSRNGAPVRSTVPSALLPGSGMYRPVCWRRSCTANMCLRCRFTDRNRSCAGSVVSRQIMSNWVLTAGERWLLPVYHVLHKELLANKILHADETTLMVLWEPERQARQRSYIWLYRTSGDALRSVVLYDYQPSRAGVCASCFLKGFSGYLHTDGYEAYHCSLPETVYLGCS